MELPEIMSPEISSDFKLISAPKYTGSAGVIASRREPLLMSFAVIGVLVASTVAEHVSTGIPSTSPVPLQSTEVTA